MKLSRICTLALVSICVSLIAVPAGADVRLPKIIGDHMVLQQGMPVPIWGWADAGEEVTVTLGPRKATATAGDQGEWMVKLDPLEAGGPQEMTVQGKNTVTIADVLVGEVWVCSGQSNMEFPVAASNNGQEEIAAANYAKIRLFTVARKIAEKPLDDCEGAWAACSPATVPGFSAVGYFFGRQLHQELEQPVGLINTSWGGTLAEAWTSREGLSGEPDFEPILQRAAQFDPKNPNQACNLYNGMLHPLMPFGIRGAIWYQGESNASRAAQYHKLFPAMIGDWRKSWGEGDFPFLFVQLAPFRYRWADPRCLFELWEAQRLTLDRAPKTGMAVTLDVGNLVDIHPKNKQDVGRRLALWALADTYGKDLVHSGPLYDSMSVEGNKIRVRFKHVGGGLVARGALVPFVIAGADGRFWPANVAIDGETLVVQSDHVSQPVAVRYAWFDTAEPSLFNKEGLPAAPFRTDDYEMITAGNN